MPSSDLTPPRFTKSAGLLWTSCSMRLEAKLAGARRTFLVAAVCARSEGWCQPHSAAQDERGGGIAPVPEGVTVW